MKMNKDQRNKGIFLQYREYTFEMTNLGLFKGFQSLFIPLLERNWDASLGVDLNHSPVACTSMSEMSGFVLNRVPQTYRVYHE
mgnify:CR=1 FL=1